MGEVEENNDAARLRRTRLLRGIRKMRLERAILLESLAKRMRKNGAGGAIGTGYDEDSEDSSDNPPTVGSQPAPSGLHSSIKPQERPLRTKKSHRRAVASPPPGGLSQQQPLPSASSQPPPTSYLNTPLAPAPESDRPSAAEPITSPAAPHATRPPPPKELFIQHMVLQALPELQDPEYSDARREDLEIRYEQAWPALSDEDKSEWHRMYEDRMEQYTRSEDQRKKAMNAEWRKAKQHGKADSGDDVEMQEVMDERGDREGNGSQRSFATVNR